MILFFNLQQLYFLNCLSYKNRNFHNMEEMFVKDYMFLKLFQVLKKEQ